MRGGAKLICIANVSLDGYTEEVTSTGAEARDEVYVRYRALS